MKAKPSKANQATIDKYLQDRELGKPIGHRRKKPAGKKTIYKERLWLYKISKWIGKDFQKVTQEDVDNLRLNLRKDKYRKHNGEPYKPSVKRDVEYKIFRAFMEWLGKGDLVQFFNEPIEINDCKTISREQAERVAKELNLRDACILITLVDAGFRAGELLSLKYRSVIDDKGKDFLKLRIFESKTKKRTVSVPIASEYLRLWIHKNKDKKGTEEPLFPIAYVNLLKLLQRIGEKHFKQHLNPTITRHSSATIYAGQLSHYQMCLRYGWSLSSNMPSVYINRNGLEEEKAGEAIVISDTNELRRENVLLRERIARLEDRNNSVDQRLSKIITELKNR